MALQVMPRDVEEQAPGALRVGVVLDSYNVSAWKACVIDDLLGAEFVDLVAVVRLPSDRPGRNGNRGSWLFGKYAEWDAKRFAAGDDPLRDVDLSGRLAELAGAAEAEDLEARRLDVLIWLASPEPDVRLRGAARYGVWRYCMRPPDHFWEIYETNPITRSALEILPAGEGAPLLAYEAFSATEQGWSWRQNRRVPCARASSFPLRTLRQLYSRRPEGLGPLPASNGAHGLSASRREPSNLQVASFLLRNAARTVSRRLLYAQKESYWFVAYRTDRSRFVSQTETLDLRGFQEIQAPAEHFYADPFAIEWQGKNYVFVEDYLFAQRRGCISVMEIGPGGRVSEAERVLDLPYHLSYPFVFEHEGELYMIPETLGAGRIDLYRAQDGPTRWEFVKTLKNKVEAVDTTVWIENGLFYFFTNLAEQGATVNDELYLFSAEGLLGEWKPHPLNPIVTDVRRSRGAGQLFRRQGKLIRPAQDCSVRYGYACQLNEIEVLTPADYQEKPLVRIEPDWAPGLIGTHTINSNASVEVIDGQIYAKRYRAKG